MDWTGQRDRREHVAGSSATGPPACPSCPPMGLNQSPATGKASVELRQCAWNNGVELTHIAPIHYQPGPARSYMDRWSHFQTGSVPRSFAVSSMY
jgi:hypothetical protein